MENADYGPDSEPSAELPQEVAELVGEVSEAPSQSRARNVAAAISRIAGRGGDVGRRAVSSGSHAGRRVAASGSHAGRRAAVSTGQAGRRTMGSQGPAGWHGLMSGGRRVVQSGGQRAARSGGQAWRVVVSGSEAGKRAVVSGTEAGRRVVRPGTEVSRRAVASGGQVSWRGMRTGGQAGWHGMQSTGRWLTAQVLAMAPRLPVRDLDRLRAQHPDLNREELADALINNAARASALVGMGTGAALLLPLPTAPVEVVVETLAVVGIEIKLVAELHEVYGERAPGSAAERTLAYVGAWAHRRGITFAPAGLILVAGSPLRRRLQRRLLARAGRSALSLGPLLTGAVAGAALNQRETRNVGTDVRKDLRTRLPQATDDWAR
jgi:hypothetical protein